MKTTRIAIPEKLWSIISDLIKEGDYASHTDFILEATRSHLNTWYPRLLRASEGDLARKLEELKDAKSSLVFKIKYEKDEVKQQLLIYEKYRISGMIDAIHYTLGQVKLSSRGEVLDK